MAKATAPKMTRHKAVPLSKIIPYEHNPRTHPPAQIELLGELLAKYGPDQDIVVDENWIILKGHGRRAAADLKGLKDFPVTQRFGLSDEDKAAMRIADNQVALLSGWDNDLISFEIKRLDRANFDLKLLGFGEKQLVSFTTHVGPPAGGFQSFGENIETSYCCPACKYSWSGDPLAGKTEDAESGEPNDRSMQVRVRGSDGGSGRSRAKTTISSRASSSGKKKSLARKTAKPKPSDGA